jgi:RNA polymerase sigma-70 factor (ECF subfamily)
VSALREHHPSPQSASRSDAELFRRIHEGDVGALGELFDRYARDVERVLSRLGVAQADVDDLVQATFLEVLECAGRFDGRSSGRAWLIGLAVMLVRRHRRSLARLAARMAAWATTPGANVPTPEEESGDNEVARRAQRALERLSDKKRWAFVLLVLEGMSGEEIAQSLGIPVKTVWTRVHHARRELRAALEES